MKVGIIGMGWVGSSIAISTLHSGIATELLLNDLRPGLAEGEAMDLVHGAAFLRSSRVRAAAIEEMKSADAIVFSAGKNGGPNESRLDLLRDNAAITRAVGQSLRGFEGILVVVTNPVDVLTAIMVESTGLPPSRVIGTGTMLDTARLRQVLGRELELEPRAIHAQVVGEHGDSEVVLWSGSRIGGVALRQWQGWSPEKESSIATEVRTAAYEIIQRKGATNHAIGLVTAALLRWILQGERRVLTISLVQNGAFGLSDVALSLPTVVGREGAIQVLEPDMSSDEKSAFLRSAGVVRRAKAELD